MGNEQCSKCIAGCDEIVSGTEQANPNTREERVRDIFDLRRD
jgi:hypothetical protein